MPSATFVFTDRSGGRHAALRLLDAGLRRAAVRLHTRDQAPEPTLGAEAEEVITGGILHNFGSLLQGLQDWGHPAHAVTAYADVVERGGAVIIVEAGNDDEQTKTDAVMDELQPMERSRWTG